MLIAELKSFHAVARCGSITRAAELLGVSQPTVTAQLRQLESRYGVELFYRVARGMQLSEAGRRLLPQVDALVQKETEIDFALRDARDVREGQLRIGATGPYYVMDVVRGFHRQHPGVDVSLTLGNSQSVLAALHDYRIDVASSSFLVQSERLARVLLAVDPMRLILHRSHPMAGCGHATLECLEGQTLLLREPGSMTRELTERALAQAGVRPARVLEIGSREAIRQAILAGMGCSLIPARESPPHEDLAVLPLRGGDLVLHEYIYCLKDRREAHVLAAFMREVVAIGGVVA